MLEVTVSEFRVDGADDIYWDLPPILLCVKMFDAVTPSSLLHDWPLKTKWYGNDANMT